MAMVRSHTSKGVVTTVPSSGMPSVSQAWLLWRMSMRPSSRRVRSTTSWQACSSAASRCMARAPGPIPSATWPARSRERSATTTRAPSLTKRRAVAPPIPPPPPVMMATLPSSLFMYSRSCRWGMGGLSVHPEVQLLDAAHRLAVAEHRLPHPFDMAGLADQGAEQLVHLDAGEMPPEAGVGPLG